MGLDPRVNTQCLSMLELIGLVDRTMQMRQRPRGRESSRRGSRTRLEAWVCLPARTRESCGSSCRRMTHQLERGRGHAERRKCNLGGRGRETRVRIHGC